MLKESLHKILASEDLSREEAKNLMDLIMDGQATDAQIGGILIALKQKGEKSDEITGFVESMRQHSLKVHIEDQDAVDGCGTGGDGKHTFNISTAASLVASSCGATVAKHGNRSVSSKCGSSELLEATGGNIDPGHVRTAETINRVGFGFIFAPKYHPSMKYAINPRRELGVRTVFNILGPLTNPATVKRQVIGVYDKALIPVMADVLKSLGSEHFIIAHSRDGMDEFSLSAPTDYREFKDGQFYDKVLSVEDVGLSSSPEEALVGGDAKHNLEIFKSVLNGEKSAYRDAVILNSGAILYVAGKAESIKEGVILAADAIDQQKALEQLNSWIEESNRK